MQPDAKKGQQQRRMSMTAAGITKSVIEVQGANFAADKL
jgi:hypothetical protein